MNVHENARSRPSGKGHRAGGGWVAAAAEAAGESVRTAYKWLARLRAGGERMLHDRSSAPGRTPHATPAAAIETVEALRRERMSGPAIARELGLPRVAIGRPPAQVARITLTQFWHGAAGSGVKVPPAKVAPRRAPRASRSSAGHAGTSTCAIRRSRPGGPSGAKSR